MRGRPAWHVDTSCSPAPCAPGPQAPTHGEGGRRPGLCWARLPAAGRGLGPDVRVPWGGGGDGYPGGSPCPAESPVQLHLRSLSRFSGREPRAPVGSAPLAAREPLRWGRLREHGAGPSSEPFMFSLCLQLRWRAEGARGSELPPHAHVVPPRLECPSRPPPHGPAPAPGASGASCSPRTCLGAEGP